MFLNFHLSCHGSIISSDLIGYVFILLPIVTILTIPIFWLSCKLVGVTTPRAIECFMTLYIIYITISVYIVGLMLLDPVIRFVFSDPAARMVIGYTVVAFPTLGFMTWLIERFFKYGLANSAVIALIHAIQISLFLFFVMRPTF